MRTFVEQQKKSQRTDTANSIRYRTAFSLGRAAQLIPSTPRTLDNPPGLRMSQSSKQDSATISLPTPVSRLGHDFSRIHVHPPAVGTVQVKFAVNRPGDRYEQEADRVATQVMNMPDFPVEQQHEAQGSVPLQKLIRDTTHTGTLGRGGSPLPDSVRSYFEPRFDHDFSQVRVFTDDKAASVAHAMSARALTVGQNIFFRPNEYQPTNSGGRALLAHELTHIIQQSGGSRTKGRFGVSQVSSPSLVQRRLIATGSHADIDAFMALIGPAIGLELEHDPATNAIRGVASLATPATSPALAATLTHIMDDAVQDAEVHMGRGQAGVAVGAFPAPPDLTGGRVQQIDIDDVLQIEAGARGSGLAKIAHEIQENYHAHSFPVVAGTSRYPPSHREALASESAVAQELVGPGNRVASVTVPIGSNISTRVQDFENYFLVFDLTQVGTDFSVSNARQAPRVNVATYTIDGFVTGSDAVPAAGAATIATVVADLAANPTATVRIEGFTDDVGVPAGNDPLSLRRAENARDDIIMAGATGGPVRFHVVGRGEAAFVAPNNTAANRSLNRRVVIRIDRPGP
jgi:outer membrane protein OmpA-like peptidoglycan-associated protein